MVEGAGRDRAHHVGELEGLRPLPVDGGGEAVGAELGVGRDVVGGEPGELAGLARAEEVRVLDLEPGRQRVGDDEPRLQARARG